MRIWIALTALLASVATAEFDYFSDNRQMIRNGVQAVLTCNGLFTSNRPIKLVEEQELAYLTEARFGGVVKDSVTIDTTIGAVTVGGGDSGTAITAAFREGIGCVVLAPDQSLDDIDGLPELTASIKDL